MRLKETFLSSTFCQQKMSMVVDNIAGDAKSVAFYGSERRDSELLRCR